MENNYHKIDEALLPFHEHLNAMLEIDGNFEDKEAGFKMMVHEVTIESPLQLDIIVDEDESVTVGSSPPLYYVDTAVQPVFHNIRFRAVITEPDNKQNES